MEQYIPKSALVAEIEKLEKLYCYGKSDGMLIAKSVFDSIKNIIDTFEVKEVDLQGLEKEIAKGKNIPILKKILLWFFESANANNEEFSKAIEDIENGLI